MANAKSGPLLRLSSDEFIPGLAKLVQTVRHREHFLPHQGVNTAPPVRPSGRSFMP